MITSTSAVDALWLETLNRICGRAAHELKGALNGVAVNLEVVRARSAKPDAPASAVATYAEAASKQFEAVMDMSEAVLALARAMTGPREGGRMTRQFAALLAPVASVDGHELVVDDSVDAIGAVSPEVRVVQLAIGATLLAAIESAPQVVCRGMPGKLEIRAASESIGTPADEIVAVLRDAGIDVHADPSAISITFPR